MHHQFYVPYAFGAFYAHFAEAVVFDTVGTTAALVFSRLTTRQALWFINLSVMKSVDDHCGYSLPWDPFQWINQQTAAYHDIHHQNWGIKVRNFLLCPFSLSGDFERVSCLNLISPPPLPPRGTFESTKALRRQILPKCIPRSGITRLERSGREMIYPSATSRADYLRGDGPKRGQSRCRDGLQSGAKKPIEKCYDGKSGLSAVSERFAGTLLS